LDALWDDHYVSTGPDGTRVTKGEELAAVTSPDLSFRSLSADQLEVRLHGNTAIVLGRSIADGVYEGQDISGIYPFTTVFVHADHRWTAVASHATAMQPE
jgi:hypothetical protein